MGLLRDHLPAAGLASFGLGLATAALGALGLPDGVWIATLVLAAICLVIAAMQLREETLAAKCRLKSREVYEFLADREPENPARDMPIAGSPQSAYDEYFERVNRFGETTVSRYKERFSAEALFLFNRAVARGWIDDEQRTWFETPIFRGGVESVARTLGELGQGKPPRPNTTKPAERL